MPDFLCYFNGAWIPRSQCKVSIADRGFVLGDAIYEAERTFDGAIFDLDGHMDRLYRSLKYVRIDPGLTRHEMAALCRESVRCNEHLRAGGADFALRQYVTRGSGASVLEGAPPTVFAGVEFVNFKRFAHLYDQGAHVVFTRARSYHPDALDPKVKHLSRMNFVMAELEATDADPEAWPVLQDHEGSISEGISYNFWIVSGGVIKTPRDRHILHGVTRKTIIDLARRLDIPVVEADLHPYDAYTADEAFITATSYSVLPVSKLDGRPLAGAMPGPVVRRLLAAWSEMVGVDIVEQARGQAKVSSTPA